jgi:multisubunit Na+/H+ antiporter MnhE subunit
MRRLSVALIGFGLGAAFYLLLVDTPGEVELFVMVGVGILASGAFVLSREQGFAEATIRPAWLRRSWRIAVSVPVHIALLCSEAMAQLVRAERARGVFRAVPFDAGSRDVSRDAGRRALAEVLGSLAPNTIVIGVDPDRDLLLVHQLHRQGGREQLDVLGLG